MAGLGGAVDEKCGPKRLDECVNPAAVANIELMVVEPLMGCLQPVLVPAGISTNSKEIRTHVVVNAVHFVTQSTEVIDNFGPDQTGRASHKNSRHRLDTSEGNGRRERLRARSSPPIRHLTRRRHDIYSVRRSSLRLGDRNGMFAARL